MHWWTLQSRGGALVDQPLQRWPTGGSSTPGGGQLLETNSLEVYMHIHIYVYKYTHAISTYVQIHWLALRFMGGALVGQPFQGWPIGGSSAICIYICIYIIYIQAGGLSTSEEVHW